MIPFLDLKQPYVELKPQIDAAIARVLESGWYILGEEVEGFERDFAAFAGAAFCVGVGNGLDALVLALRALDIGPGDEVLVPSNTYIATWLAVSLVGAIPVPVEPDSATYCMDPERARAAISSRTRAVLAVHLYGHAARVEELRDLCDARGLYLVEDAAQAHGARSLRRPVGATGHIVAWSFYPGKNLGALGDGGAVTTDDPALAKRLAMLRNYGSAEKYVNEEKGVNSRLDPLQAAVLRVKLEHLSAWNERRQRIAAHYEQRLRGLPVALPSQARDTHHAWHLYVIATPLRDALQAHLRDAGVGTLIHYPIPPFRQRAYSEFTNRAAEWPIADRMAREVLSLPMGPHLDLEQVDRITEAVAAFFAR